MPKAALTTTTNRDRASLSKTADRKRRTRSAALSTAKKAAPRSRRATPKDEPERMPPIMQPFASVEEDWASEVQTIFGLIEALGGADELGKRIPTKDHGNRGEHVLDWARKGFVPAGLHLRLYGMAADTPGWQGLIDIYLMVSSARRAPPRRR
jgi:hypothetical protein